MRPRARWAAFRDELDRSPPLADADVDAYLARIAAEPEPWLRRACLVTLVRGPLLTDDQLRAIAAREGGKLARFIGRVLARRASRPRDC